MIMIIYKKVRKEGGQVKRLIAPLILVFLFSQFVSLSCAEVYKWVDEKGKVWITDYPNPKDAKKKGRETAGKAAAQNADPSSAKPEAQQSDQKQEAGKTFSMPENFRNLLMSQNGKEMAYMAGPLLAMLSGLMQLIGIAFYLYACFCLFYIARKVDTPKPWTAWIPFVNLWTFVTAAGKPPWWIAIIVGLFALSIIPGVGILFGLLNIGVMTYLWMCITANVGKNKWLGLLMLVPIVFLIFPAILAFSRQENLSTPSGMPEAQS